MEGHPAAKKKPNQRKSTGDEESELHAAPGASDTVLGNGSEPSLPTNPLALTRPSFDRIGTDLALDDQQTGRTADVKRAFYGLYYSESSGAHDFKLTLPPFWAHRKQPSYSKPSIVDDASVYGLILLSSSQC